MSAPGGPSTAGWYPDPAYKDTLRYWDGRAWTELRHPIAVAVPPPPAPSAAPPPVAAPPAAAATEQREQVDNTVAWTLAFAPLISLVITGVLSGMVPDQDLHRDSLIAAVLLNCGLAIWDANRVARAGYKKVTAGAVMLLVPLYLILRAREVPRTTAIPIVWCVCFLISLLVPV